MIDITAVVSGIADVDVALAAIIGGLLALAMSIYGINAVYKFIDGKSGYGRCRSGYGRDGYSSSGDYEKCFDQDRQKNRGAWALTPEERKYLQERQK